MTDEKKELISRYKKDILLWEGFKPPQAGAADLFGLGPIEEAFPNGVFPKGVIHEFLNAVPEHAAAAGGFIGGLLALLMKNGAVCLWISRSRKLFPPSMNSFGVEPDQVIFVDLERERDVLWVMEEALKCPGFSAVVAEIDTLNFTESRRLQLAVEQSRVTGFILRTNPKKANTTVSAARWKITPIPSETEEGMPGVGFPRWQVRLLKVRNGNPGVFQLEWSADRFLPLVSEPMVLPERFVNAG